MSAGQITKRLEFDAGHRVLGHEGHCACIHGHRYAAEITVQSAALDAIGRAVDFGVVKAKVGAWINEFWDHNLILNSADPLCALPNLQLLNNNKPPFVLHETNPTAENLAEWLFRVCDALLPDLAIVRVRLYETPSAWADFPVTKLPV